MSSVSSLSFGLKTQDYLNSKANSPSEERCEPTEQFPGEIQLFPGMMECIINFYESNISLQGGNEWLGSLALQPTIPIFHNMELQLISQA